MMADEETRKAIEETVMALRDLGARVEEASAQPLQAYHDCKLIISVAEFYSVHEATFVEKFAAYGEDLKSKAFQGAFVRATDDTILSRVAGVLERSGTSDDNLFFVPLNTAQRMFQQPERLTAIAIRLRDPALLQAAAQRLQRIPGAQVVTLTEMMGTFLSLVEPSHVGLSVLCSHHYQRVRGMNTLLAVVECTMTFVLRAGASRLQILAT
jgi:hypothetical protein